MFWLKNPLKSGKIDLVKFKRSSKSEIIRRTQVARFLEPSDHSPTKTLSTRRTSRFIWAPTLPIVYTSAISPSTDGPTILGRGHKVILLVGGRLGVIGDMRDTERELKPLDEIEHNKKALSAERCGRTDDGGRIWRNLGGRDWWRMLSIAAIGCDRAVRSIGCWCCL